MAIVIVGETGVGKSTVGRILSYKTNYNMYEIGHVVKKTYYDSLIESEKQKSIVDDLYKHNPKDYFTKKRLEFVSRIVRTEGNDYFVRKLLEMHSSDDIIIIGARSDEELDTIISKTKYPFIVALTCEDRKQENRFVNRENKFMNENTASKIFNKRIDIEKAWGVDTILGRCDMVIPTSSLYPEEISNIILQEYDKYLYESLMKGNNNERKLIR